MKESFVLYTEMAKPLEILSDEQFGRLMRMVFAYMSGESPEPDAELAIAWGFLRQQLDKDISKWEDACKKRSEAGRKHKGNQHSKKKNDLEQMEQVGTNGTNGTSVPKLEQMEQVGTNGTDNEYDNDTLPTNVGESNKEKAITKVIAKKKDAATAATNQRKSKFYDAIRPYVGIYGADMCRNFFDYWSELNKSGTKMRWEQQPTWELELRLKTWSKNETKYGKRTDKYEQKRSDAAAIDAQIAADVERLNAEFIANGCKPPVEQVSDIDELYGCLQSEPSGSDDRAAPG